MASRKVVMAGAGGLIGKPLAARLGQGCEFVRLKREAMDGWFQEVEGARVIINLCGEPIVGKRWTAAQKQKLIDSRIQTTRVLVDAIARASEKPKVFINASAIGYYGPRGDETLDETADPGVGFLAELCRDWEKEARRAVSWGVRTVWIRTGIVLSREGGALAKMLPPFQFFLGGSLGTGRQAISWIHLEDEISAIQFILENPAVQGAVNLTAPNPVTMNEFAKALGRVLRRPSCFPVPAFILRALLGEMSDVLLIGQNALPNKLLNHGFRFRFHRLEDALRDLLPSY